MPVEPRLISARTHARPRQAAAGLLNLSFDDLWKREQRRQRSPDPVVAASSSDCRDAGAVGNAIARCERTARAQERADRLSGAITILAPTAAGARTYETC